MQVADEYGSFMHQFRHLGKVKKSKESYDAYLWKMAFR